MASYERLSTSHTDTYPAIDIEQQQGVLRTHVTTPTSTPVKRSTAFLDGLRGLAALIVFIQHSNHFDLGVHGHGFAENGNYYIASLPFLRVFFSGGEAAVTIFFVLSGYVLSKGVLTLLRDGQRKACFARLASAVARRPLRLYIPPLAVSLGVAIIMQLPLGINPAQFISPDDSFFGQLKHWFDLSVMMFNPFKVQPMFHAYYVYNVSVWTLPLELQGSWLVYGLLGLVAFIGLPTVWIFGSFYMLAFVLHFFAFWKMGSFIAGLTIAVVDVNGLQLPYRLPDNPYLTSRVRALIKYLPFLFAWYLLCQPSHGADPWSDATPGWGLLTKLIPPTYEQEERVRFWQGIGSVMLIHNLLKLPKVQTFFNTRPLQELGRLSFSFYLVHLPILNVIEGPLARALGEVPDPSAGGDTTWWDNRLYVPKIGPTGLSLRWWCSMAILLPFCLFVAHFATKTLDEPSVKAGAWLAQKLGLEEKKVARQEGHNGQSTLPMSELRR